MFLRTTGRGWASISSKRLSKCIWRYARSTSKQRHYSCRQGWRDRQDRLWSARQLSSRYKKVFLRKLLIILNIISRKVIEEIVEIGNQCCWTFNSSVSANTYRAGLYRLWLDSGFAHQQEYSKSSLLGRVVWVLSGGNRNRGLMPCACYLFIHTF